MRRSQKLSFELKKKVASVNNDSTGLIFVRKNHTFLSKGTMKLFTDRMLRSFVCFAGRSSILVKASTSSSVDVESRSRKTGQQVRSKSTSSINQSVSKLNSIYNSDSSIFKELLNTLNNDPLDETTQTKIEKFLLNQALELTNKKAASAENLLYCMLIIGVTVVFLTYLSLVKP
jgi:hypothetical protein